MAEAQRLVRRLATARNLSTVVRTMKAFAALRIRQFQRAAAALQGYDRAIELGFAVLLQHHPELLAPEPRAARSRTPPVGAVLIGSEHGLCGSFNERLADFAHEQLGLMSGDAVPLLLVVGRRLTPALQRFGLPVADAHELPSAAEGITPLVERVLPSLEHWHDDHGVEWLYVMHHRLDERGLPRARARLLAPIDRDWLRALARTPWPGGTLPTFRSAPEPMFRALSRQRLVTSLQRALADSLSAENSARLSAMQAAERNIEDHTSELERALRRERQERITTELLDIQAASLP